MSTENLPKVLAFDVFGTVVDWHGSIANEINKLNLGVDGSEFALAWRAQYQPSMSRVRSGELGWTKIDDLHRMNLDTVLADYKIEMSEADRKHLNKVWHRLNAWPDSSNGLQALRNKFMVCSLSNGNLGLLANMARHAALPWDLVLSAEVFRHYKPDPKTYLGVCDVFDVEPNDMMLVAAHKDDLQAAQACGCRTAFIARPDEFGPKGNPDVSNDGEFNFHATSIEDLARQTGCI